LYDLATGRKLPRGSLQLAHADEPIARPSYLPMIAPDRRLLAAAPYEGGDVQLRELATGMVAGILPTNGHAVMSSLAYQHCNNDRLAFSPDGRLLAAATGAGAVLVWDLATRELVAELPGHRGAAFTVTWSPDGKQLASSGHDMTLLVWDAAPWQAKVEQNIQKLTAQELDVAWQELASPQAEKGHQAFAKLVRARGQTVVLLRERLKPAVAKEVAQLRGLIADLSSDKFAVRHKALRALEQLGDLAHPALEPALAAAQSLETRRRIENLLQLAEQPMMSSVALQQLRALSVLEMLGTTEARALLKEVATGEPEAWRTHQARAALKRLGEVP
jgi:hypothetical protein